MGIYGSFVLEIKMGRGHRFGFSLPFLVLALMLASPAQGQGCNEGSRLQQKLCAAMMKAAGSTAQTPSSAVVQPTQPPATAAERELLANAATTPNSGSPKSSTFNLSGSGLVKGVNENLESRQSRSNSLNQIFSGFPGKAIEVFDVDVKPTDNRSNHITVSYSYRLSDIFISRLKDFATENTCSNGDETCRMDICLGYGRVNCVPIGAGPKDNSLQYPLFEQLNGAGTRPGFRNLGFAIRFVDKSGERVGSGWCSDVFLTESDKTYPVLVYPPGPTKGYMTAYAGKTFSNKSVINVSELSSTVDLERATGIQVSAFAYMGGPYINGTFDVVDQSKPISVLSQRMNGSRTDVVMSPKEMVAPCGWAGS